MEVGDWSGGRVERILYTEWWFWSARRELIYDIVMRTPRE